MQDRPEVFIEVERLRTELMLTNADVALRILDLADTSATMEDRERRRREASDAYESIRKSLPALILTTEQRVHLNAKLSVLKMRLYTAGLDIPYRRNRIRKSVARICLTNSIRSAPPG